MADNAHMQALEPLIGAWTMSAEFSDAIEPSDATATSTFEWLFDGAFVLQRSTVDHPMAPDGHMVIQAVADREGHYVQHYFDSRGVVRTYAMTFDGRTWTLTRTEPDFTPLEFCQRFVGTLSDDGRTIDGRWESSPDGQAWELDFRLRYAKR